ncbi:MAG TPA: ABC transporter ATP-binding protein [Bryobacteraceae bacterium]|nr:ABC transporter ATP-binding protein [Bryobacteraceae bacterium]
MRYGEFCALDCLDLDVRPGEILALLGPNGAGKSTALNLLAGLQTPTSGSVTIAGVNPQDAKRTIGVMPENLGLFAELTVEEHLRLTADIYGAPKTRIAQLLRVLQLERGRDTFASECSHGMRKKTSFAMALLHNPRVLLLDEPFEAVDPVSARIMFDLLRDAAHQHQLTVFLTSHMLSIVERLADRFALLRAGKLIHTATADLPEGELEALYFSAVETPVSERLDWLGSAQS